MSVIWQKVWFDLWHNKVRTTLSVLSIAAGVFAIGAIFGMSDTMLNGMDAAHRSVTPSHVNMFLTSFISRDDALALRSIESVEDVEPYNLLAIRYKVRPEDDWKQGSLVMRDDYTRQRNDFVQLKQGAWPQGKAIGIERLASQFLKIGVADHVLIRYNNTEHEYPIGGLIRHPFVPPPDFGGPPYFFANAEQLERFGVPNGKFSSLLIRVTPYSEMQAKAVAAAIKDRLAKQGVGVGGTLYQNPDKHWGRMYVEGMTLVMQVLACISLFMSVVLFQHVDGAHHAADEPDRHHQGDRRTINHDRQSLSHGRAGLWRARARHCAAAGHVDVVQHDTVVLEPLQHRLLHVPGFNPGHNTADHCGAGCAAAGRIDSGAGCGGHHGAAGNRQLWVGRRLRIEPVRSVGGTPGGEAAAVALRYDTRQSVPAQRPLDSHAVGPGLGGHDVSAGDDLIDFDHLHARRSLSTPQLRRDHLVP
jgi:uncharacterized membrane protein